MGVNGDDTRKLPHYVITDHRPPRLYGPFDDVYAANRFGRGFRADIGWWAVRLKDTVEPLMDGQRR